MGIFSDGVHLISNQGLRHLHSYCARIGIKKCWFHNSGGGRFPHYDIPKLRRATFFTDHPEVVKVSSREIVSILKEVGYGKEKEESREA